MFLRGVRYNFAQIFAGLIIIGVIGLSSMPAHGSAWTLEPKTSQTIVTSAFSNASAVFDTDGQSVDIANFSKSESRIYTEIGLLPSLMFVGQAGVQTINFTGAGSDVQFNGFGETKLGLQYRLQQKEGMAASILASYIIDGGLDDPRLNIGGRNDEIEIRALYGRSKPLSEGEIPKWVWFYDIQAVSRYDLKSDQLSRWQLDLTAGLKPDDKWMGLLQLYALDIKSQTTQGFTTPGTQQLKGELSLAYQVKDGRYLQLGVLRTLTGRNIVQEKGVFMGFWQAF